MLVHFMKLSKNAAPECIADVPAQPEHLQTGQPPHATNLTNRFT